MEQNEFKAIFAYFQKYFGKEIEPQVQAIYFDALKKYPFGEIKKSAEKIISEFVPTAACPFPLVCHFLDAMGETGKNKILGLINKVKNAANRIGAYASIDFGDCALHETIRLLGGWPFIARCGDDWWQFNTNRFIDTYEACQIENCSRDRVLGIHEIGMAEKGLEYNEVAVLGETRTQRIEQKKGFLQIENIKPGLQSIAEILQPQK